MLATTFDFVSQVSPTNTFFQVDVWLRVSLREPQRKKERKNNKKIKNTTNPKRAKARKPEKRGKIMDKLWL